MTPNSEDPHSPDNANHEALEVNHSHDLSDTPQGIVREPTEQELLNAGETVTPLAESSYVADEAVSGVPQPQVMPVPSDFWAPWESVAHTLSDLVEQVKSIHQYWQDSKRIIVWRGQSDATRPLYSSLYRRLRWTNGVHNIPQESDLQEAESKIVENVFQWGLHNTDYGRLSYLNQLALLQHYGAPTRMIDVTFNPWIGIWFAVEEKWENGSLVTPVDARVFAIDVTDVLINNHPDLRHWEDSLDRPWPSVPLAAADSDSRGTYNSWTSNLFAWRPPHFHPRLAAQNGGFLFGGVPAGQVRFPKNPDQPLEKWPIADVRRATSVAFRLHQLPRGGGAPPSVSAYTVKIDAGAVIEIRKRLTEQYGYSHSTIYPDYPGFSMYAVQYLKSKNC